MNGSASIEDGPGFRAVFFDEPGDFKSVSDLHCLVHPYGENRGLQLLNGGFDIETLAPSHAIWQVNDSLSVPRFFKPAYDSEKVDKRHAGSMGISGLVLRHVQEGQFVKVVCVRNAEQYEVGLRHFIPSGSRRLKRG